MAHPNVMPIGTQSTHNPHHQYRSLAKKGPWALYLTLSPDKGVGGYL